MSKPQWNKVLRQRVEDITEWHLINEDGVEVAKVYPNKTWAIRDTKWPGRLLRLKSEPSKTMEEAKEQALHAAFNAKLITTSPQTRAEGK